MSLLSFARQTTRAAESSQRLRHRESLHVDSRDSEPRRMHVRRGARRRTAPSSDLVPKDVTQALRDRSCCREPSRAQVRFDAPSHPVGFPWPSLAEPRRAYGRPHRLAARPRFRQQRRQMDRGRIRHRRRRPRCGNGVADRDRTGHPAAPARVCGYLRDSGLTPGSPGRPQAAVRRSASEPSSRSRASALCSRRTTLCGSR